MAKAKQLPSGAWRCRVYSHTDAQGRRHYESFTSKDKKEAEALAANFVLTKNREEKASLNFKEAMDFYIELKEPGTVPKFV